MKNKLTEWSWIISGLMLFVSFSTGLYHFFVQTSGLFLLLGFSIWVSQAKSKASFVWGAICIVFAALTAIAGLPTATPIIFLATGAITLILEVIEKKN